jgi:hypothetical protein
MSQERFPRVFFPVPARLARRCGWFASCRTWALWQRQRIAADHFDVGGPRCAYCRPNGRPVYHCPEIAREIKEQEIRAREGLDPRFLTQEEHDLLLPLVPARFRARFEEIWYRVDLNGVSDHRYNVAPWWLRRAWAKLREAQDAQPLTR